MDSAKLRFAGLFALVIYIQFEHCISQVNHICAPSSCGHLHNISFPFRLKGDPENCGYRSYEFSCENNLTSLYLYSGKYLVQAINYNNATLRVVDFTVKYDNCSSLPRYSLTGANFSFWDPYDWRWNSLRWDRNGREPKIIVFFKCSKPVNSPLYVDTAPCINGNYSYVMDNFSSITDVENSCRVDLMVLSLLPPRVGENVSYTDIYSDLAYGFELSWHLVICEMCRGKEYCFLENGLARPTGCSTANVNLILAIIGILILARSISCTPCVMAFLIYTWSRRHSSMYKNIEEFLQNKNNLGPVRYSYSDVRKMTNGFKDKLGQGGYGSVYKGKLRSGRFAAIKMLGKAKGNGQEFINEVASIGQVHHVNVVQLIGFCADGSKRALVYDYMPNGSLDKYVLSREGNTHLSWKQMHEISLGVARGIDYLHRGCEMQILHFDIKPHNILLDENFVPKVSDFGLAKLHKTSDSTVALTAARGTIGYIAPELFYRNIGGVTYKADVYSFGMLLMEMVGKKKNLNAVAENSSQAYFPNWVYNEVIDGNVAIRNASEEEEKIAKKIIMVGLWCIQMKPNDRPSMNKVVEMLEGDLESLEVPPKPTLYTEETPVKTREDYTDETWSSSWTPDSSESISLLVNSNLIIYP
ncbi:hypothetical protein JCGZ_25990 [Jatropha curcas]|uniref:Protein kinase domain-containing protein n=1 Tax=Jatropha curcas TaxID=180498 RepID=A0A067JRL2_JATCU|nr:LEAF RUST 10 DISEASE-RESISTANCE LOCUS RECEPTOR-LIKE PROTEIN KINASE-like 2.4 isoform X2 [Jatropha curcas]KDP22159.1 hypothetical protein JCGZ_25990 [Jatropha curcas]